MKMKIINMGSPEGIGYILQHGWQKLEEKELVFGEGVVRRREEATEEMPFAGDVIQSVIDEHNITNSIRIPLDLEDILKDIQIPEHTFTPQKGKPVWFPVENNIKTTDPFSMRADPAMGYVRSVDEDGKIEMDVRKVYRRVAEPSSLDETRKMTNVREIIKVENKFCFENRRDCMDYVLAEPGTTLFRGTIQSLQDKSIQLTDEDLKGLTESDTLIQ